MASSASFFPATSPAQKLDAALAVDSDLSTRLSQITQTRFRNTLNQTYRDTDAIFIYLMLVQWVLCVILSHTVAPSNHSSHPPSGTGDFLSALLDVRLLTLLPIVLALRYPGRVFTGEIVEIDSRIDAVSRAFRVRADLPNEDRALPAGMFMQVTITLDGGEAAVIPEEAVVAEEGSAFVFVVEDGKAARRTITTGRRAPGFVEVVDGLAPDALVVTRGTNKLRDGAGVKLASGKTENGG